MVNVIHSSTTLNFITELIDLGALPTLAATPGTGPIQLSRIECTGSESRLSACPSGPAMFCSHSEDAGVVCQIGNEVYCNHSSHPGLRFSNLDFQVLKL